jgi:hypothetical protein
MIVTSMFGTTSRASSSQVASSVTSLNGAVCSLRPTSPMMSRASTSRSGIASAIGSQVIDVTAPPCSSTSGTPDPGQRYACVEPNRVGTEIDLGADVHSGSSSARHRRSAAAALLRRSSFCRNVDDSQSHVVEQIGPGRHEAIITSKAPR